MPSVEQQSAPAPLTAEKLVSALNSAWKRTEKLRERREQAIQRLTEAADQSTVNLTAQTVLAYLPTLVTDRVRNEVEASKPELRIEAIALGLALDRADEQDQLDTTLRDAVLDAIVSPCSIMYTTLAAGCTLVKVDGRDVDPGGLITRHIPFTDYLCDPSAPHRQRALWESHRYTVPRERLEASGIFSKEELDKLPVISAGAKLPIGSGKDKQGDLVETVELWDIAVYNGDSITIVTIASTGEPNGSQAIAQGQILYQETFEGPAEGPYDVLKFVSVPGTPFGVPPVDFIRRLDDAADANARKIAQSARETKQILGYRSTGKAADDAEIIAKASHLQSVRMDDPESAKLFTLGGVAKEMFEANDYFRTEYGHASASAQQLSGDSQDPNTATEARILQGNSSIRVRDMQQCVQMFRDRIAKHRLWYLATDPLIQAANIARIPGGETMRVVYDAATRSGTPTDFSVTVKTVAPDSADPMVRAHRLLEYLQTLPARVPLVQIGYDLGAEIRLMAQQLGIQELDELFPGAGGAMVNQAVHAADPQMNKGVVAGPDPSLMRQDVPGQAPDPAASTAYAG